MLELNGSLALEPDPHSLHRVEYVGEQKQIQQDDHRPDACYHYYQWVINVFRIKLRIKDPCNYEEDACEYQSYDLHGAHFVQGETSLVEQVSRPG